nr:nucleolin 2-like [Aegilops tauschii subsp. strangulata]
MARRGKAPHVAAAVSVHSISELSVGRHRTRGGKRSTSISRKGKRQPAPAAIAGIRFGRFGMSPTTTPRRRWAWRKRLPKANNGEGSIVSGPANLCSSAQIAAGIAIDDIEQAGIAKKQKTVSQKGVLVKNHLKVKKKLIPPHKVKSSTSDEYSSESEDETTLLQSKDDSDHCSDDSDEEPPQKKPNGSSSGAAKPASKDAKKESSGDDHSSEESSSSDEQNDQQVSVANSKKNEVRKQFFEEAGEVIDIHFATSDDGSIKGSTHVEFATTEAAEKAYKLNGRDLAGRPVRLDFGRERGTISPSSRRDNSSFKNPGQSSSHAAFIRGFDSSLGKDEIRSSLQQHLSSCGEITRVSVAKEYDTCASKGSLPKVLELTGSDLGGCSLSVDEAKPSPDNRDDADSDRGHGQSGAPPSSQLYGLWSDLGVV